MKTTTALAAASLVALSVSACSAGHPAATPKAGGDATVSALAPAPDTASAAKEAAAAFFALYSAGYWPQAWQLLTPADQRLAPEKTYVGFHDGCPSVSAGAAYKIEGVTMAGKAAVVTYTIPVVEKVFGSATIAEDWTRDGWRVNFTSGYGKYYAHGSVKADVAAAKAAGECSGS